MQESSPILPRFCYLLSTNCINFGPILGPVKTLQGHRQTYFTLLLLTRVRNLAEAHLTELNLKYNNYFKSVNTKLSPETNVSSDSTLVILLRDVN